MGKKVKKRDKVVSSGLATQRKANQASLRLRMKIARWERNQSNPQKELAGQSRKGWNTTGLYAHLSLLQKQCESPAKRPKRP